MTLGSSNPSLRAYEKSGKVNPIIEIDQLPKTTVIVSKNNSLLNSYKYLGGYISNICCAFWFVATVVVSASLGAFV